jgi:hypothetical protein
LKGASLSNDEGRGQKQDMRQEGEVMEFMEVMEVMEDMEAMEVIEVMEATTMIDFECLYS